MHNHDELFKWKRQVATFTVKMLASVAKRACDASGRGAAAQWAPKASKASPLFVSTSKLTGHLKMQMSFAEMQPKRLRILCICAIMWAIIW